MSKKTQHDKKNIMSQAPSQPTQLCLRAIAPAWFFLQRLGVDLPLTRPVWDSNLRPPASESRDLATELLEQLSLAYYMQCCMLCVKCLCLLYVFACSHETPISAARELLACAGHSDPRPDGEGRAEDTQRRAGTRDERDPRQQAAFNVLLLLAASQNECPLPRGTPAVERAQHQYQEGGRVLLTEILLPRIARLPSNCSTGNCLSDCNKRTSSNSSNG